MITEGLKRGDLRGTILKSISIDAFQPKTGAPEDAVVISFASIDHRSAKDLYSFLNGTFVEFRDIDVSSNPNQDNHFLVFVEVSRTPDLFDVFDATIAEVSRVAGNQDWCVRTRDGSEVPIRDESWKENLPTTPSQYLEIYGQEETPNEEPEMEPEIDDAVDSLPEPETNDADDEQMVAEFLRNSDLQECSMSGDVITLGGRGGYVKLKLVGIGNAQDQMRRAGITEAALDQEYDNHLYDQLNNMLGTMRADWVSKKIVIYDPNNHQTIMVAKPI